MVQAGEGITQQKILEALATVQANGWYNIHANADYIMLDTSTIYQFGSDGYQKIYNALTNAGITNFFIQNINSKATIEFTFNSL
jgi:hypothetical protein